MKLTGILHHGTDQEINNPIWNNGSRYRDFGQCFYTTYNLAMAKNWAKRRSSNKTGVVCHYVIDFSKTPSQKLHIKRFNADAEWAEFVYNNRYNPDFKRPDYDIIIGPLADNKLTEQFQKIKTENKTFEEIAMHIKYSRYKALQICFCSDNAMLLLRRVLA